MLSRLTLIALVVVGSAAQAAEAGHRQFADWAIDACVKARKLGEVVYEKNDGSPQRYAKFDWQQLQCVNSLDTSGQVQTGVVEFVFALRRSDYVASPAAAQRLNASTGLGAAGYQLFYREIDGQWRPVAYRPLGNSYTLIKSAELNPEPVRMFSDAQALRAFGAVPARVMAPLLSFASPTCSAGQGYDVVCEGR